MNPADPSLAEAPQPTDDPRRAPSHQPRPPTPGSAPSTTDSFADSHNAHMPSESPPMRKDTVSSTTSNSTTSSALTITPNNTVSSSFALDTFPSHGQPVFSAKDGNDAGSSRRGASRRRTGPLSAEQREKAAIIRRVGACESCRRRRVACHPNHHNMTWEDAYRKFRPSSPVQDQSPLSARPSSPRTESMGNGSSSLLTHDPQEMEIDSIPTPTHPPGRTPLLESRIRTPLPSGPRLEKIAAQASQAVQARVAQTAQPSIENIQSELQTTAFKIASNPYRSRYTAVQALLLHWEEEKDDDVSSAVGELAEVLEKQYQYVCETKSIPSESENCKSSWRWLSRVVTSFVDNRDQRDVLKIVYYIGQSYLNGEREMVLASSRERPKGPTIRWSGIQQILEEACSDTLIVMDAAYYPPSKLVRQQGILEVVAASASEDHFQHLSRTSFTREITNQLRTRASQRFLSPLTAAELHVRLLSSYPNLVQDRSPEKQVVTSFPSPLHLHISANTRLPSILLAPVRRGLPMGVEPDPTGPQLNLTIRLSDDALHMESWAEWLRLMPDGVKDVKIEGPYRGGAAR